MNPPKKVPVDNIKKEDFVEIKVGDAILWTSGNRRFTISAMECTEGNGPVNPFEKHFPNADPPSTQVNSGGAIPAAAKCKYKYTVAFDHGPAIDPTVIIEE